MEKLFYLDNAATTKPFAEIYDILKQENDTYFYNPSASYKQSVFVKSELNKSRESISKSFHASIGKLYFTSSATESNNTVFNGVHLRSGQIVLISSGEHPSVYNSAHNLEKKGIIVKDIPLNSLGEVDFEEFKKLVAEKNVALVSIIHSSNETGRVNDIKKLCDYTKKVNPKILFHSDGVQAFGKIKVNLQALGVDMYTISAHKVYSVRGIGGLYVKNGVILDPFILGGGQENGFRSSTENVSGAIAFAYSVKRVLENLDENYARVFNFKEEFLKKMVNSEIGKFMKVNSPMENNPYVLSLSFDGIKGEVLMNSLESFGILISTGSACSAKKAGNRVLSNMGLSESEVIGSVRVSFSPYLDYDFDYIVKCFENVLLKLRSNLK